MTRYLSRCIQASGASNWQPGYSLLRASTCALVITAYSLPGPLLGLDPFTDHTCSNARGPTAKSYAIHTSAQSQHADFLPKMMLSDTVLHSPTFPLQSQLCPSSAALGSAPCCSLYGTSSPVTKLLILLLACRAPNFLLVLQPACTCID